MTLPFSITLALFLASFIYVISPGPAFLTILALTAKEGRKAGALFVTGHLVGDLLWGTLALGSLIGVGLFGKGLFEVLGLICGLYLAYLGYKAAFHPAKWGGNPPSTGKILVAGALFGVTNPKAYPVALAMFTSFVGSNALTLTPSQLPYIFAVCFCGFIVADTLFIAFAGLKTLRSFFLNNQIVVTRFVGVSFILFGLKTLYDVGVSYVGA